MKILYLCQDDPRLQGSGSLQRTHYLWSALKTIGDVYTLCSNLPNGNDVGEHIDLAIKEQGRLRLIAIVRKIAYRFIGPFSCFLFPKHINLPKAWGLGLHDFDIIVSRYMWRVGESLAWKYCSCYIDVDDLPSKSIVVMRSDTKLCLWYTYCSFLTKIWERKVARMCSGVWVADPNDKEAFDHSVKCFELRNIAKKPTSEYVMHGRQKNMLLTVGYMGYPPNWRGVLWFCKAIWPAFSKDHMSWEYWIVGKDLPESIEAELSRDDTIKVCGYVEDLQKCYESASAVVAPILEGAGTCIKVEEACCYGRKTFGPEPAFRGMSQECRKESMIEVFDDAATFAEQVSSWIAQSEKWEIIQDNISHRALERNSFAAFEDQVKAMFA